MKSIFCEYRRTFKFNLDKIIEIELNLEITPNQDQDLASICPGFKSNDANS